MVKITNGIKTFTVSKGAFNSLYKAMGYSIIDGLGGVHSSPNSDMDIPGEQHSPIQDDDTYIGVDDLNRMSFKELKELAEDYDIDISGISNKEALKNILIDNLFT